MGKIPSLKRWLSVFTILVVLTIAYIDRVNMSILITNKPFLQHFGILGDRVAQGDLTSFFLLAYGLSAFFLSPVFESYLGVRKGLIVSVMIWTLMTVVSPITGVITLLLASRVILGASEGPFFSLGTMHVRDTFDDSHRGKANAIWTLGISFGLAIGFPLITSFVYQDGWQWSFYGLAVLNLFIGLPLILLFIKRGKRSAATLKQFPDLPAHRPAALGTVIRGAIKTPGLAWVIIWEIFNLSYLWGINAWLPSYLLEARHFSIKEMGVLSSLPSIVAIISTLLSGYLIDKMPKKTYMWVIGGLATALSVTIAVVTPHPVVSAVAIIVANLFWGIQGPVLPTIIQSISPEGATGTTYGIVNGLGNLASAFVPAVMGVLIASSPDGSFAPGFSLLIGAQVIAAICGARLLFFKAGPWSIDRTPELTQD